MSRLLFFCVVPPLIALATWAAWSIRRRRYHDFRQWWDAEGVPVAMISTAVIVLLVLLLAPLHPFG